MNKGVPGMFVTLLAGVGLGLALGKLLQSGKAPAQPIRRNPLAINRLHGYLEVERN